MEPQFHTESEKMDWTNPEPATAVAARETAETAGEHAAMEAELASFEQDIATFDFEESLRNALEGFGEETSPAAEPAPSVAPVQAPAQEDATSPNSLESVELELALHNQNVVSLGFEGSIRAALKEVGGEILFQMRVENEDCQRIAAVRVGQGEEQQFALVILPPGGGLMRVEPVAQSKNPLALITESYAGLVDVFRAAA